MAPQVEPIPPGFHTVTPHLSVRGGVAAMEFYKRAFGAEERSRFMAPDGVRLMHGEMKIGDSIIMLGEENPQGGCPGPQSLGATTVGLYLYVQDADTLFNRAVAAGAKSLMPMADMFWGDRAGTVADPFGHQWTIATHKEGVPPDEMQKRGQAFFEQMARQQK
ncbi:MAG TPA: VOC family protein [Nitrospira sp.]|nr:VOC family protein [Nitrospira sp.]